MRPGPVDRWSSAATGCKLGAERVRDAHAPRQRPRHAGAKPYESSQAACNVGLVQLRQAERLRLAGESAQLGVEPVSRARCEPRVAMPRHCAQEHGNASSEAFAPAGDERERRQRIDVGEIETPGEEARERDGCCARDLLARKGSDHCDADGSGVEPSRVRSDDIPLAPAVAPFVHGAVAVDEEVVADVVPAVRLHVVHLDAPHDRGRLGGRVVVRSGGVMDDGEPHRGGVLGSVSANCLVGAPAAPRDDGGRSGDAQRTQRHAELGAAHE